jgi:hypothetical protein
MIGAPRSCSAALVMACALAACGGKVVSDQGLGDAGRGGASPASLSPPSTATTAGSIRAQLELPAGAVVSSLKYTLTGGGFIRSSTQALTSSDAASFRVGDVPAPDRYTLDVIATSADGSEVCSSSAMFDVAASKDTLVILIAQCSGT